MPEVRHISEPLPNKIGLPQSAAVLAYAGALAPITAAIALWIGDRAHAPVIAHLMLIYGGVMIAYFGGVRWGVAVMQRGGPTFAGLLGGVIPLGFAAPVFLIDAPVTRFAIIVFALPILLWDDLRATRRGSGAPDWYLGVRTPMTLLMTGAYFFAMLRILTL